MFENLQKKVNYITCFFLSILTCFCFLGSTGDSILGHSTTKLCPHTFLHFISETWSCWVTQAGLQFIDPPVSASLVTGTKGTPPHSWDVFTRKGAALTPSLNLRAAFHYVITPQGPLLLESTQALLLRTSLCKCLWIMWPIICWVSMILGVELLAVRYANLHLY